MQSEVFSSLGLVSMQKPLELICMIRAKESWCLWEEKLQLATIVGKIIAHKSSAGSDCGSI